MSKRTAPFEEEIIEEEFANIDQNNSLRVSIKKPTFTTDSR